jgi:ATP-dependent Lhr-like helicase
MSPPGLFHPLVERWFRERLGTPTEPQRRGWPEIAARRDTLIAAPTGSGKTLAAFLGCLDRLVRQAAAGELADRTQVVYVSPLKALGNDVQKNLERPLFELRTMGAEQGLSLEEIRVAVRTGDTPAHERQRMMRKPPHILITTPESLYILLTSRGGRALLAPADTVIIDEIHAVADDKRGSHLALSLERLDALAERPPVRIGLSATQKPIEAIARLLVGSTRPMPVVVDAGHRRDLDLGIEVARDEMGAVCTNEQWQEIYDRLAEHIRNHKTTLVFVNTRRLVERVAHHLAERLGEDAVAPHHGSLARKVRLHAEQRLKSGQLKAVVASASLELGIDVGTVELVCQLGSPRTIAVALQRIGRAGHCLGLVPKGRLFPLTRDDLVEAASTVRAIRAGELDRLEVPQAPLDILAQQIVAACAAEELGEDELFERVRRAAPYAELSRPNFDAVVAMLADGVVARRGRSTAHLHHDRVNHRLRGRRGARLAAITSGGAIPEVADYQVVAHPDGAVVGTLDEDFAVESMAGDVFLLGNTSWRIRRVEAGRVHVEDAGGAAPTIPFWRGEGPSRSRELSAAVAELRLEVARRFDQEGKAKTVAWLVEEAALCPRGADQVVDYVVCSRTALGGLPTQTTVIAERFFDEAGGMQLVVHAPFGARINRAWGLALRKRFCRSFNLELQAAATDNGILLSLTDQHSFPLELTFGLLRARDARRVLEQATLQAPMFQVRWRWNATRSLALLRQRGGKRVPPPIQRMRADDLLAACFPAQAACAENLPGGDIELPEHPLVSQTMADCLSEAMDLPGFEAVLASIESGAITCLARDTAEPSPLCHEILNANPYAYLDDAPLEERRARAVSVRRSLPDGTAGEIGALDAAVIDEVQAESWPDVRSADELHDALSLLGVIAEEEAAPGWAGWFDELRGARRATRLLRRAGGAAWVAAERLAGLQHAYPEAALDPPIGALDAGQATDREATVLALVRDRMQVAGPVRPEALAERLALPGADIEAALVRLELDGLVLRGRFTPGLLPGPAGVEWCERHLLARIHRRTLARLRKEIEPVSAADFMRFLFRWQHVAPGTRLHGRVGLRAVIQQLQGFELPAAAWERKVLPARLGKYDPGWLDTLCLGGEVVWGRLSLPERQASESGGKRRRGGPTRAAPIALTLREDLPWLLERCPDPALRAELPHAAVAVYQHLERRGASFFSEIVSGTRRLPAEIEDALGQTIASGLVTADGFSALRSIIGGVRRREHNPVGARHASGRFALLHGRVEGDPAAAAGASGEPVAAPSGQDPIVERAARQLLRRWGVVCRDLLARESRAPAWRDLAVTLRRMEARGEIRGGRFLAGTVGEHFALPEAVELLRSVRRSPPGGEVTTLAAADPLNLVGILTPGARVPPASTQPVVFADGVPQTAGTEAGAADDELEPAVALSATPGAR